MNASREYDIALSFAGENREYVDQVAILLRDSGVKVFYDLFEEANLWGKDLYEYLSDIYKNKALYTIMFISEHYGRKAWSTHERKSMQARAFQENQEYVLPARFDNTPIPGVLPTVGYISLTGRSPSAFAETIRKKLINNGQTVPSEFVRRSLFSTTTMPRVDPKMPHISVYSTDGCSISKATVVAIADNATTKLADTNENGVARLIIATRRRYQILIAHPDFPGAVVDAWDPADDIKVTLASSDNTGSVIFMSTGYIPGLEGRLNPILDTSNRTYLYADNIAIDGCRNRPAKFKVGDPFDLEDSNGMIMQVRVLYIQGQTSLLQYVRPKYDC